MDAATFPPPSITGLIRADLPAAAYAVAAWAHHGQFRDDGAPYITHPARVANTLTRAGFDPIIVAAAFLHDVVEDTTVTLPALSGMGFPHPVVDIVDALTKRPGERYLEAVRRAAAHAAARYVKLADTADNADPTQRACYASPCRHTRKIGGERKYAAARSILLAAHAAAPNVDTDLRRPVPAA